MEEMADREEIEEVEELALEEEGSTSKGLIAALIGLTILIPSLVIAVIYNINPTFRNNFDGLVSKIPAISSFKEAKLTPLERTERIKYLAKHYTTVKDDTAADKLYIIKQEDEALYKDILREMRSLSAEKTKRIEEKVRARELDKDLLVRNYEEAMGLEGDYIVAQAKAIEGMDLILAKKELRDRINDPELKELVANITPQKLSEILYYMKASESEIILSLLDDLTRKEVKSMIDSLKYDNDNLQATARLLDKRPVKEAIDYIDNNLDLTPEELAVIFENMSIPKAAQIAQGLTDRERLDQTFYQMNILERLMEKDDQKANNISELVDYISEYYKKIDDLATYYKNVEGNKAAPIFQKLINNNKNVSVLTLNDPTGIGDKLFKTTDRRVAVDVASRLKPKKVSEIISEMDPVVAAFFTELLAHPDKAIVHEVAEGEDGFLRDPEKIRLDVSFNDDNISELSDEFGKRLKDLAKAFDKMETVELAKIVRSMLYGTPENNRTIARILSNTKPETMSKLLTKLSQGDSTTLSNIMATDKVEQRFPTDPFEYADKMSREIAKVYDEMEAVPLATLIKRTVDDAYDYEDTDNLDVLIRVLEKMKPDVLSEALDLLNPDMSGEITDLIYQYKEQREVKE